MDHLLSITKIGSVYEYQDRFEQMSIELPHVPDDILEYAFLQGLKKEVLEIKW